MTTNFLIQFGKKKVAREELYGTKNPIKISYVDVNNKVISKLIELKNNSKYFIGYLNEVLVLIALKLVLFLT